MIYGQIIRYCLIVRCNISGINGIIMGCENDKERRKEIYPDNSDLNKSSRLYVKSVTIS